MEDLLKKLLELMEKNHQKQKVVIIETNSQLYHNNVVKELKKNQVKLTLSIWPSTDYGTTVNEAWEGGTVIPNQEALIGIIDDADLVLIPSFSHDLLVKGALCMSDTSSSYALQVALMKKKAIVALDSGINLALDHWQLQGLDANEKYNRSLALFREKLVDFGVEFISIIEFPDFFSQWINTNSASQIEEGKRSESRDKKAIITHQDVAGKHEIILDSDAKLTELAQDYIRDNGVNMRLKNERAVSK